MNKEPIMVSVCMITYNHEKYIGEAIEGVILQKTNFPIELIIGEDCSTDNTRKICIEYQNQYPELIKLQLPDTNKGMMKNFVENMQSAQGKYIALCEGDDYWIDSLKLQKQVDFLEVNQEFGLVHTDCHFYYEDKGSWLYNANKNISNASIIGSNEELFYRLLDADYKIRTATVLFRSELLKKRSSDTKTFLMGDTPMWLDFSQLTKFKYFAEPMVVYRILSDSASRSKDMRKQNRFSLSMAEMRIYYCNNYNYEINTNLKKRYNNALLNYILFDAHFKPLYPLFEPNAYQQIRLKYSKYYILNIFFTIIWFISKYAYAFYKKERNK